MKIQKLLTAILTIVLLLGTYAAIARAQPINPGDKPDLYLLPDSVTWTTSTHSVGDTFTIKVYIANVSDMGGYQFDVNWDPAVLQLFPGPASAIVDVIPFHASFIGSNTTSAGNMDLVVASTSGPVTLTSPTVLRTIIFQSIEAPPAVIGGSVSSTLKIANDVIGDHLGNAMAHYVGDSLFTFNYVPPAPPSITAGSKSLAAPATFDIPITVTNYASVYALTSVHFVLTYNAAFLTATGAAVGTWGGAITVDLTVAGQVTIDVTGVTPVGTSGTVALIHFNGFYNPGPGHSATCALHFTAASFNTPPTAFTAMIDGTYTIAVPSLALKAIYMSPNPLTATDEGEYLTLKIAIANITSVDQLFGTQFTLSYDPYYLTVISATEGPFFSNFLYGAGTYFFPYYNSPGVGQVTVAQGLVGGVEPPGYVFPYTNNNLVTDHDVIAYVNFFTEHGLPNATVGCALNFSDVIFGNYSGLPITVGLIHNGAYSITMSKYYIDLYTQYPAPYGGQLRFHDADAYGPQSLVCLYTNVTYNGYPVMNKPVAFEIEGPPNSVYNITIYRTAFTDSNGVAVVCFRIEWPAQFSEAIVNGVWTVVARVDIDQVQVYDILHFRVGWLVEITKVTTDFANYNHLWYPTITVDYQTISAQPRSVFFTTSMVDEANNGMGSLVYQTTVQSPGIMQIGYGSFDVTGFQIPIWARAGVATVYANAYTADPTFQNGVAYCPEVTTTFGINAA